MSRYNVNEGHDERSRREVMLTGFSSSTLDDVLRSNNNEPSAPNGNPGDGSHVITKDTKAISFEVSHNSDNKNVLYTSGRRWLHRQVRRSCRTNRDRRYPNERDFAESSSRTRLRCVIVLPLRLRLIVDGNLDFISGPVSVGFTSAASIIIATSQVKDILGIKVSGTKFVQVWQSIFEHISETRHWDTTLGIVCIIILLLLRKVKDCSVVTKNTKVPSQLQRVVAKLLWLISTARNIIVVIVCAVMCWLLEQHLGESPVILTGHVKQGLPDFRLPPFETQIGNETYTFIDMISALGTGCLVVPMLSLLETISIAKVFSDGKSIDATQEMLALGACNIMSSFVSSMPVSGGLSRGAVNHSSGVKTTLGGVYTGVLVLISLQFLTPYLYYIPKAALAAVIIAAVVFTVEFQVLKPMWRSKKIDLIPAFTTFLCCLLIRLELGIVIGIGINLLFLLYASARPTLRVRKATSISGYEYLVITPDRSLVFPSVEYVRTVISKQGLREGTTVPVVIDSTHIQAADFTAAKGIKTLIEDFSKRGQPLIFHNLKPSIVEIFKGVKPSGLTCSSSELELNDCLKDSTNSSVDSLNRY